MAVNLNLMQTGQVLFWAGDFSSAANFGELWNPANNVITDVPNPFSNIFCSANVHLADGRLLVAGGHDKASGALGLANSNIFDPVTRTWQNLPNMAFRRWYPTTTMLGERKGHHHLGLSRPTNRCTSIFPVTLDPVAKTWTQLTNARMSIPQYPMVYLLPDGRLLQSGTTEEKDRHAHARSQYANLDYDRLAAARWRQRRAVRAWSHPEDRQFGGRQRSSPAPLRWRRATC